MGCNSTKPKPTSEPKLQIHKDDKKVLNEEAKVVLLGDSGVGKSSIAMRYVNNTFSEAFEVTIGGGYLQQTVRLRDGSTLKLDIWDTGGQERFRSLLQLYYRDANAAFIVYDVTSEKSLESCEYWVNELSSREENCIMCLVGNKIDIPPEQRKIKPETAQAFAARFGMLWMEASAKTGQSINELFEKVATSIINKKREEGQM